MKLLILFLILLASAFVFYKIQHRSSFFWGYALEGSKITEEQIERLEQQAGFPAQLVEFYLQWSAKELLDLDTTLTNIWNQGAVPCLTWEPMHIEGDHEKTIPFQQILNGDWDPYLLTMAETLKKWGHPLILRFAHEMNLIRYHWGTEKENYGPKSPQIYVEMFRYVVDFFRKQNVKNVLWAFCPNVESLPIETAKSWNVVAAYYPGDSYVDILGMDGYNWGTSQTLEKNQWNSEWKSFSEIFSPLYHELRKISKSKPMIIFETGSVTQGGDKEKWIEDAIHTCAHWNIHALIWFFVHKETDWRFHTRMQLKQNKITVQEWAKTLQDNR